MQDINSYDFETLLTKIKEGNNESLRNDFISKYTPFIIKTASNFMNEYIEVENSEEFSVALRAFNEAIDRYDVERGKFLSFAKLVINSRLKDFLNKKDDLLNDYDPEIETIEENRNFENEFINRDEIKRYEKVLNDYGITLESLTENSPTHHETRCRCLFLAEQLSENEFFISYIKEKKRIPITKIARDFDVSKRMVSYSKEYILSLVLIYIYDFEYLKNYIEALGGECNEKR